MAFAFGLQTLQLIDFSKVFQIKGLKSKNKGHTNFYECCDLTKKMFLMYISEKNYVNLLNWQPFPIQLLLF